MKVNSQSANHAAQYQQKNWVADAKIPMPGSDGVSFKDLVSVKNEMQNLKIGAAQQKK